MCEDFRRLGISDSFDLLILEVVIDLIPATFLDLGAIVLDEQEHAASRELDARGVIIREVEAIDPAKDLSEVEAMFGCSVCM